MFYSIVLTNYIINICVSKSDDNANCVDIRGSLVGVEQDTVEKMYSLYCKHARCLGFSVRKSTNRFSATDKSILLSKLFVCSCTGIRTKKQRNSTPGTSVKKRRIGITRTDCKARMLVKKTKEGNYAVVQHETEHNHELTRTEWNHMHRSERQITTDKSRVIEDMVSSGMRTIDSYRYMTNEVGGEENLGHTIKDHYNLVNKFKMEAVKDGDANNLINMMEAEEAKDKNFFYKIRLNEDGRLSSIFWRDSLMMEDYEIYGDVMVFDTTYRTNKYNLICAPFVGVNNHWKNVMFGCAFISDEKTETFEWLFQMFKISMGEKVPKTVFTDQDLAIANAIGKVKKKLYTLFNTSERFMFYI